MNDQTYVTAVKKALLDCIEQLDSVKWLYLMNPDKDFTRDRKITFERFINICLQMDGGTLQNELMKHFDFVEDTPTKSAFCQQRAKVSPEALKFLFYIFTEMLMEIDAPKTFKGYRLLACDIETTLTWKQTNHVKDNRQAYTFVSRNKFDFYENDNPYFPMKLRILCIEVAPGQFEYLATNLDRDEFSPDVIKELYHYRWGQENSFRDLKYTIDLVHFHCKKREYIEQEAWARLIVYNFCEAIARHIVVAKQSGENTKHDYKINFATAACICKAYLKRNDDEINVCRLIGRFLIPIRQNRSAPRKIKPQSAKSFLYRAA